MEIKVAAWRCAQCAHVWLKGDSIPQHCAKCHSRKWNMDANLPSPVIIDHDYHAHSDEQSKAIWNSLKRKPAFDAIISPAQFESCKKEGHRGFQRSDGYWCITCAKMFR